MKDTQNIPRPTQQEIEFKKLEQYHEFWGKYLYWYSAIMIGTFAWVMGSFDKFTVNGHLPFKYLFMIGSLALGISVVLIGVCADYYSQWKLKVNQLFMDITSNEITLTQLDKDSKDIQSSMDEWMKYEKYALYVYGFGFVLIFTYIYLFLIKYR